MAITNGVTTKELILRYIVQNESLGAKAIQKRLKADHNVDVAASWVWRVRADYLANVDKQRRAQQRPQTVPLANTVRVMPLAVPEAAHTAPPNGSPSSVDLVLRFVESAKAVGLPGARRLLDMLSE